MEKTLFDYINLAAICVFIFLIIFQLIFKRKGFSEYIVQFWYRGHGKKKKPDIRKLFTVLAWVTFFVLIYAKVLGPETMAERISEWLLGLVAGKAGIGELSYHFNKKMENGISNGHEEPPEAAQ